MFYRLFYNLEECGLLDQLDERHLFALHYVYVPRINKALDEFRNAWNHHSIRTANNKSPYQLFAAGMLFLQNSQLTAMDYFEPVEESYGRDEEGPEPADSEGSVSIPQLSFQLDPAALQQLHENIDPVGLSDNYAIGLYEDVLHFIQT